MTIKRSTFSRQQPGIHVFKDNEQREVIRAFAQRLADLERTSGLSGFNSGGRSAQVPPSPTLHVTSNAMTMPGQFFVRITNPQFIESVRPKNPIRGPIIHSLDASQVADFSTGVTSFPVSAQTYYHIAELGTGTWHFRLRSSYDGQNFTLPVLSGSVTA